MKKTIGKYMVVGMVALTMTACNDSFLERTPTNNLNDAMYWKSEADLKAYANGIYNEAASNGTYKFMVGFHSDSYSVKITVLILWRLCLIILRRWMVVRHGLLL